MSKSILTKALGNVKTFNFARKFNSNYISHYIPERFFSDDEGEVVELLEDDVEED